MPAPYRFSHQSIASCYMRYTPPLVHPSGQQKIRGKVVADFIVKDRWLRTKRVTQPVARQHGDFSVNHQKFVFVQVTKKVAGRSSHIHLK